MSAGKVIANIAAGIMIFFGVLFIWATFSPQGQIGWLVIGLISVGLGFGLIFLANRPGKIQPPPPQQVNLKIDLSGDVNLESLKCKQCGGALSTQNISMLAGAPVVACPYCGASYQLTEEPKW